MQDNCLSLGKALLFLLKLIIYLHKFSSEGNGQGKVM